MNTVSWQRARAWAANEYLDAADRAEVQELLDAGDRAQIDDRFYRHLRFGTGGMRAVVGQGTNRLNRYNIRRASRALAGVLENTGRVVVCYDSRRTSLEFAKEAAGTFAAAGVGALIFREPSPVALVSFAIRERGCGAGVMITASHNPPEYNGYKVFWSDGAQVTPPRDGQIVDKFGELANWSGEDFVPFEEGLARGLIRWVSRETENAYFAAIKGAVINENLCRRRGNELGVVYSALHGTGTGSCVRALQEAGSFRVEEVAEQARPDGNFPTVSSPNPENPEALALAVELMKKCGADIALATDPDTDRVGLALSHGGEVVYPNGHQLGALMLYYILQERGERGTLPPRSYMVKTLVTSPLQERIAAAFGVEVENTLTGFKWICGRMNAIERESPDRNFVFATEESFGYLHHPHVRDKDGVSSVVLLAEVALWYKTRGMTLVDGLEEIYQRFGRGVERLLCLDYSGKAGEEKIHRIMESFRTLARPGVILAGLSLSRVEDLLRDGGAYPKSNVLGLHFAGGERLYLRPSGTEPKIKFYLMVQEEDQVEELCAFIRERSRNA